MEDVLSDVILLAAHYNLDELKKEAEDAYGFLGIQQGLVRDPPYELRAKCFVVFQKCLETKKTKFMALATAGFSKMIKDDRFHSNFEPANDSKWLPSQLLQATDSFLSLTDDTQIDILKLFLNIACANNWSMNGRIIISIISLCMDAFESGNVAVRAAAQACASQNLRSFCKVLEEEQEPNDKTASSFNEIIPIMQFLCSKIDEAESSGRCEHGLVFLLESVLALCSSLPQIVHGNQHLIMFLWQKFCPVLISVLGTPRVDKNIVTRSGSVEEEKGRGSGCLAAAPSFTSTHAKAIYSINIELVRLVGCISSLRPVLESLFHRVLLYPAPKYRYDAIKSASELLGNPNRVLDIAGPLNETEHNMSIICDMSLIRLIMDSLEESTATKSQNTVDVAVFCCVSLLKTLQELCTGNYITKDTAVAIHRLYPKMEYCDYQGPKTYQGLKRLPKTYCEKLQQQNLQSAGHDSDPGGDANAHGSDSESSIDTDGPEEELKEDNNDSKDLDEENTIRDKITATWIAEPREIPVTLGDSERQHAKHFVAALKKFLPDLVSMRSCIQVDQALQKFASQYCQGVVSAQPPTEWGIIVNADGIYFATYAALLLDLALNRSNYYSNPTKEVSITEDDFVNEVQNSGVVVYLSGVWLRELYQAVVSSSLLLAHGYLPTNDNSQQHALINLLTDVEGGPTSLQGSQMLSECLRLEKARFNTESTIEAEAGMRLSRQILTCCWDSILKILSIPLTREKQKLKTFKLKSLNFVINERREKQAKEKIAASLEGLQIAACLCNKLGLQDRCGNILELLSSASCPLNGDKKPHALLRHYCITSVDRLTTSHALNMELLLGSGLELGSHCSSCWPHIFRCCVYVKKLERNYFSRPENRALSTSIKTIGKEEKSKPFWQTNKFSHCEEDTSVDVYGFLCPTRFPQTVTEIISSRKTDHSSSDLLEPQETAKIISILSQLVDKLFEDAAMKLNLKSLESFSRSLCIAIQGQLFPPAAKEDSSKKKWWSKFKCEKYDIDDHLLLDSLGEVMLKSVRSGRPLIHVMKIWALIGPYLMESASHKDVTIARKAVKHMHDGINACLNEHSESPHFHVNESLLKPFENLLCLELCDTDVQDQIVSSLCELVEANYFEIRSGWRPLFGALRVASVNIETVLDIFKIFLKADNALVFSNTAIDCILCLLNQIRGHGDLYQQNMDYFTETLNYLRRCENILGSLYRTPHFIVFSSAHRIQVSEALLIDPNVPDLELVVLENIPDDITISGSVSYAALSVNSGNAGPSLDAIDQPSGVLRVWFLLLEGLHSAAVSANSDIQPNLLEMLFSDLTDLLVVPGPSFGLYCINRFILPVTQSWLRQLSKVHDSDYSGFKQSVGLLSDLIGKYFEEVSRIERLKSALNLMLTQAMLLLAECCIHPVDTVARLGSACFRHILNGAGIYFNQDQWNIASLALHRACDVTLTPIRQLMMSFRKGSQNFYGDNNQIKIAARSGVTLRDIIHLKQLSQQVFLLDCQRDEIVTGEENEFMNDRSYTFLLTVSDDVIIRIPMKILVVALLSHQSLLQVVAGLLLHEAKHMVSSLENVLFLNPPSTSEYREAISTNSNLPGFMRFMSIENINLLLSCLDLAYHTSLIFDSRPGLKFLVQKVASLERAANLYRQAGAAWTIKTVVLFEICLAYVESGDVSADDIHRFLDSSDVENEFDFEKFLKKLRQHFNELCSSYIDLISGKSEAQKSPDQSTFFLITCQDDNVPEVEKMSKVKEYERIPRPFFFSDFTRKGFYMSSSSSDFDSYENYMNEERGITEEVKGEIDDKKEKQKESQKSRKKRGQEMKGVEEENMSTNLAQVAEVLNEYRKEKKKYLKSPEQTYLNPSDIPKPAEPSIEPELEMQRHKSFLKDEEAHRKNLTEMFGVVFELLAQLNDAHFRIVLPVFFDGIRRLTGHACDSSIKQAVADLFHRISVVFELGSP